MNFEKAKVMSCCSPIPEITLAPTPITTIKILDNIVGRLHQFADRMGVQI